MGTWLCSTERNFDFVSRLNEDVSTYISLGKVGNLFFTLNQISSQTAATQANKGGLTDIYLKYGTYLKSFYSVMFNPSCVKVSEMGEQHKRLHHRVSWNNAVPKIVSESLRKKSIMLNEQNNNKEEDNATD